MVAMRNFSAAVALGLCVATGPVCAGTNSETGEALLRSCNYALALESLGVTVEDMGKRFQAMHCIGYVQGVMDGYELGAWKASTKLICLPEAGISVDQAIRIVVKHLNGNPEQLHMPARAIQVAALAKAFPCVR